MRGDRSIVGLKGLGIVPAVLLAVACVTWPAVRASGQTELYNNGRAAAGASGLATGSVAASGARAPSNAQWSEPPLQAGAANAMAGFACFLGSPSGALRIADDFSVPSGQSWTLQKAVLYVYGRNAGTTSPVSAVTVRIWNGPPGAVGSQVVAGDTTSNRMVSSTALNLYRIFATTVQPLPQAADTTRRVWQVEAALPTVALTAGSYWLDVQFSAASAGGQVFIPPVTMPGRRDVPGANARFLKPGGGINPPVWSLLLDQGKPATSADLPVEIPFAIIGVAGANCSMDYNRDGVTNLDDLSDFTTDFNTMPPIPAGLQPQSPTANDRVVGYGVPCPSAANASPPYASDAYRRFGYRVAFALPGTDPCGGTGPTLDNFSDFVTAFWAGGCP